MAKLKAPYQFLDGLDARPRQQLYRNFAAIQDFLAGVSESGGDYTFDGDVTVTGALSSTPDGTFGVARVGTSGNFGTSLAEFSHIDQWSGGPGGPGSYGILQRNTGQLLLNAPTGQTVVFRINNSTKAYVSASSLHMVGNNSLLWDSHGGGWFMQDSTWVRTVGAKSIWASSGTIACDGKMSIGIGGGTHHEKLSIGGGVSSGISIDARSGGARWAIYPDSRGMLFWEGIDRFLMEDAGGSGRFQCGIGLNGAALIGPWTGAGSYVSYCSLARASVSAAHYLMIGGPTDNNTYLSCSGVNGATLFRNANNGTTIASFGFTNIAMTQIGTIDLAIPALGGGNTMNLQATSSWQAGYIASTGRFKRNVRSLRDTPDPDSGPNSPIFKLRPTRFNWNQASRDGRGAWRSDGVANGDELNARFPNGVAGLIAEEVEQFCPDAVIRAPAKDPEPWDREKHGLPPTDPDTGEFITEVPGWEGGVTGLDNERLIAYLIDAVQYLKSELDTIPRRPV